MVKFLKGPGEMPDNLVLYASTFKFIGGLATLWFMHSRLDRVGSRPLMILALGLWALIIAVWVAMSGGVFDVRFDVICGLSLIMGFAFCTFNMSMTKLAMATVPELGKSHFFALYSVVGSLAVGVFPILWGILIDTLAAVDVLWLGVGWNQYSIYFTALLVVIGMVVVQVMRLEEKKAVRVNELFLDLIRPVSYTHLTLPTKA